MIEVKVRRIGNSLGVILPKEALAHLNVDDGDALMLTETPDGLFVSAYDQRVADQMKLARKGMRKYRNALRELAK